jgi:hypothetical protein
LKPAAAAHGNGAAAGLAVRALAFFAYDVFVPPAAESSRRSSPDDSHRPGSPGSPDQRAAPLRSHTEMRAWLRSWGFALPEPVAAATFAARDQDGDDGGWDSGTAAALAKALRAAEGAREGLGYDVDGVVFKVDDLALREVPS